MVDAADLKILKTVIDEYAPEIAEIYDVRRDSGDEDGSKTGRLHENHILGIILGYDSEAEDRGLITTTEIEDEYKLFFKKIARSTVSTYLNQLDKEGVLTKQRDGRIVYYLLKRDPPYYIDPFWIVRDFCLLTPYFYRSVKLAKVYLKEVPGETLEEKTARQYLLGLAILMTLRNRVKACLQCMFGIKEDYREIKDELDLVTKDRNDVLPEEITKYLDTLSELPIFGGLRLTQEVFPTIISTIREFIERFAQDIDFQIDVSMKRREKRIETLRQKKKREAELRKAKEEEAKKEERLRRAIEKLQSEEE